MEKIIEKRLQSEPEKNLMEMFGDRLKKMGLVTRRSHASEVEINNNSRLQLVVGTENTYQQVAVVNKYERPLSERAARRETYREIKKLRQEIRNSCYKDEGKTEQLKELVALSRNREHVLRQYFHQSDIRVNVEVNGVSYGEQTAKYVVLTPLGYQENDSTPPIFFVPGISNDLSSVGSLIRELALKRKVIVVGHPESNMGKVTPEFTGLVEKSDNMTPHMAFFEGALHQVVGDSQKIELWGHSAGCEIIYQMLNNSQYQERVDKAVLLCPASSAKVSKFQMLLGLGNEFIRQVFRGGLNWANIKKNLGEFAKYGLIVGKKESDNDEQQQSKKLVFNQIQQVVTSPQDSWKNAKVAEGGEIVVLSGNQDYMTRSFERYANPDYITQVNPQIRVINADGCTHMTPCVKPGETIETVQRAA